MIVRVAMRMAVPVRVTMMMSGVPFQIGMLMNVKHADQQEHEQKAAECPGHRGVDRETFHQAVRNEMQQRDAEHKAADEAHHHLHAAMRETDARGEIAADHRGSNDQNTVAEEK